MALDDFSGRRPARCILPEKLKARKEILTVALPKDDGLQFPKNGNCLMPLVRADLHLKVPGTRGLVNNPLGDIDISWEDLIHSCFVMGRQQREMYEIDDVSIAMELLFRESLIVNHLREELVGTDLRFKKSPVYDGLESSFAASISFFLGMAFAHAIATKTFGVSHLTHLRVFELNNLVRRFARRYKPDLIGLRPSLNGVGRDFLIVEAKGSRDLVPALRDSEGRR